MWLIMENKMDTTIVYWGYIGIMEKKMETTIYNGIILGLHGNSSTPQLPAVYITIFMSI